MNPQQEPGLPNKLDIHKLSLEEYQKYAIEKINGLRQIFANTAVGDFSTDPAIPNEDNEFTELYVGVKIMLDVIRDQLGDLKRLNESLEKPWNGGLVSLRKPSG